MLDEYIKRSEVIKAYKESRAKDNHRTAEGSLIHMQEHNHMICLIEKLPADPVIPIADHERMKRELNIEIQALRNAANGYKERYIKATADVTQLLEFIERIRSEVLSVNNKTDNEIADVRSKYCKNKGKLCFKEGESPFKCENFEYCSSDEVAKGELFEFVDNGEAWIDIRMKGVVQDD